VLKLKRKIVEELKYCIWVSKYMTILAIVEKINAKIIKHDKIFLVEIIALL
jgi:hypothetical protein